MTKPMNFHIRAINHKHFSHIFDLTDRELAKIRGKRIIVDEKPGYPCRISLQEADVGETIIAVPYKHHNVNAPYYSEGPIFVRNKVKSAQLKVNEIPTILTHRKLSIRAYDQHHMMIDACLTQGKNLGRSITDLFNNDQVLYLHIHNANPGCFNCCVERV